MLQIKWVLLLAFGLRALLAIMALLVSGGDITAFHTLDTGSYIQAAQAWAATGRFAINGLPEIIRTPGYPLLLLPGAWLGHLELVAVGLQVLISCFTVYLVYRVGLLLFKSERIVTVCALLYAVEPLSILFTTRILTETLFTFLVALFLYLFLSYLERRALAYLVASALVLAATAYVRPISLYLPLLLAPVLLTWVVSRGRQLFLAVGLTALFLSVSLGAVRLWEWRNETQAAYHGFSAISDINWYFYQGASVTASHRGVPYYVVQDELGYSDLEVYFRQHPEQRAWRPGSVYEYMGSEGRKAVLADLPAYSRIHFTGVLKTLTNPGGVEYLLLLKLYEGSGFGIAVNAGMGETLRYLLIENPLLLLVNLLFGGLLAVYLLGSLLALSAREARSAMLLVVVLVAAYLVFMSGGPQSLSRFRHPVMPELCVLAGYTLAVLVPRWVGRRRGRRARALEAAASRG
ncbi:MAG TPA: glycosyltransferase family 39 protein [Chloroflexia bacterium]|jgi:4-amino-4-deoxy-L-arabinose transferase-like glycosyltransferase